MGGLFLLEDGRNCINAVNGEDTEFGFAIDSSVDSTYHEYVEATGAEAPGVHG